MDKPEIAQVSPQTGTPAEVFWVFLQLGMTSFGGPIAHLGYFREELVTRRRWLSDARYADLVALCQFLPGPASSQTGFALGLMRAGWAGGLAAFAGFTMPSAVLMVAFAATAAQITGPIGSGAIAGLKIVAVAIVAQAVLGMAKSLCPDRERAAVAVGAVAMLVLVPGVWGMAAAIGFGALAGFALATVSRGGETLPATAKVEVESRVLTQGPVSVPVALGALLIFYGLLFGLPQVAGQAQALAVIDSFYRAGSLVFGGGHVVLPLLQAEVVAPGWVTADQFLTGYGAVQAVPGPLFTFAAYLGAVSGLEPDGLAGAVLALIAVFLPGFLLLIGVLPFWEIFRTLAAARSLMRGANAAVVGILGAALYTPVFTGGIGDLRDFALGLACFVLLTAWRAPPWLVVVLAATGGVALALAGPV